MSFRLSRVAPLLFFSGACALVYQVAWFRELRLIFGASTASSAAVLAVFMGGLGVGGAVLGKRADKTKNPLEMYARLELAVALAVALSPIIVSISRAAYLGLGGTAALGNTGATVVRLLLTVIVLGPATVLMGGTLPAAARAVGTRGDDGRHRVAALYGINTFGAVLGALAANFLLLEVLGTRLTLWCACLINVLVGVIAQALSRRPDEAEEAVVEAKGPPPVVDAPLPARFPWIPPAAAAVAGASFMLMELVWYRMLAPILGGSSYTFGLILAVALVGIGVGGALWALGRRPATLRGFALTCGLEALFIAIPFALGDRLALLAALLRPICNTGFGSSVAVWTVLASIVVLPAAIVSGAQFPLIIGLYGSGQSSLGKDVGRAYLANTLGAIAGSLAGGFGLIPILGALGCWRLVVVVLVMSALGALAASRPFANPISSPATIGVAAMAALPLVLIASIGPTAAWRHSGIGAGRADASLAYADASKIEAWTRATRAAIAWEMDGVESSVALGTQGGYAFIVNGKSDGHAIQDASTQVMSGLLGGLIHPGPRSALVIGLGTGSTAGWLGAIPSMQRVEVMELEPAILRVARDCAPVNKDVLANPKVHITLGDARESLLTSHERYDLVFSEPSNPYRAGISSLYTREFYRAAAQRLEKGGLFLQWIQAYDVDTWAVATSIRTLHDVFGDVAVWASQRGDLILVAGERNGALDATRMRERLAEEPYASAARAVWRTESLEGVVAHHVANTAITALLETNGLGGVNTDDANILEFAFARGVGSRGDVHKTVQGMASRFRIDRPRVAGAIDWERVDEEHAVLEAIEGFPPRAAMPSNSLVRPILVAAETHDWREVHALFQRLGRKPQNPHEAYLRAESAIAVNDPEAAAHIDAMKDASERDLLLAKWFLAQRDPGRATEALERAFTAMRSHPWTHLALAKESLETSEQIGRIDPKLANRLYEVLAAPFAVEAHRFERLGTRLRLARIAHDMQRCIAAIGPLEPFFPWDHHLLETRLGCYVKQNDPRALQAEEDLGMFLHLTGALSGPLATGPTGPPPGRPAPAMPHARDASVPDASGHDAAAHDAAVPDASMRDE